MLKKVLSIAGTDPTGGAGSQADIKTITVHKAFAMNVITAVVAQNTVGVREFIEMPPEFVGKQLNCVFEDIVPDAVKIGMVSSGEIIRVVAEKLRYYHAENIVIDPVMVATSGGTLLPPDAEAALKTELMPLAAVVTPNIPEAECLCGFPIQDKKDMLKAAEHIAGLSGGAVLVKGGHLGNCADDLLYTGGNVEWLSCKKVDNPNTHGTGCTLSSAIASNLAKECGISESVRRAKAYITGAIQAQLDLGQGSGPLNHVYQL